MPRKAPEKSSKDNKTARITVRLTPKQHAELQAASQLVGLGLSTWFLTTALREARLLVPLVKRVPTDATAAEEPTGRTPVLMGVDGKPIGAGKPPSGGRQLVDRLHRNKLTQRQAK